MTEQRPGSSGGGDAYEYHQSTGYDEFERQDEYGDYRGTGERQGSVLDEFRRQMDEMLGGTRPSGPVILPGRRRGERDTAPREDPHQNDTGLALAAAVSFWALPLALRKRKRGRLRRRAQRRQDNST